MKLDFTEVIDVNMWGYQPMQPAQPQGTFTAFVNSENEMENYLVPAGGMVVLINLNGKKMWIKQSDEHGLSKPNRVFNIEEVTPVQAGSEDTVTRQELNALSEKLTNQINTVSANINSVSDNVNKLVSALMSEDKK